MHNYLKTWFCKNYKRSQQLKQDIKAFLILGIKS
jgi:hypothetical protein